LFPSVAYGIANLKPDALYSVGIDLEPVDLSIHRFDAEKKEWTVTGERDPDGEDELHFYAHPQGSMPGSFWFVVSFETILRSEPNSHLSSAYNYRMSNGISFPELRLTNDPTNVTLLRSKSASTCPYFILRTFTKYTPRLHIRLHKDNGNLEKTIYTFADADFVALSHYLNPGLRELKAVGFLRFWDRIAFPN
jgi:hypothetical protein